MSWCELFGWSNVLYADCNSGSFKVVVLLIITLCMCSVVTVGLYGLEACCVCVLLILLDCCGFSIFGSAFGCFDCVCGGSVHCVRCHL